MAFTTLWFAMALSPIPISLVAFSQLCRAESVSPKKPPSARGA